MALIETIKHEGPKDALVWRKTGKDYMLVGDEGIDSGSQLIVDAFYEAILFANGYALDTYGEGNHTLTTQNIPLLKAQYEKLATKTPFPCKIYFINKTHHLDLKWGTQGGIAVEDPVYNIFLHVGCCGTMAIRISDSRKFLLKFVGDKEVFTNDDLIANFRGIISSRVKDYISKIMILGSVSYFVMNAKIYDIGEMVKVQLQEIFDSYGVSIEHFNIESIKVPNEDYQELQAAKQRNAGRVAEGATWDKEKMYEVLKSAAENEGMGGTMMGAGMGMGMGTGIGVSMGQAMNTLSNSVFGTNNVSSPNVQTFQPENNLNNKNGGKDVNVDEFFNGKPQQSNGRFCPSCGKEISADARFCCYCGNKIAVKAFCPGCGAETVPGASFCSSCGTKI